MGGNHRQSPRRAAGAVSRLYDLNRNPAVLLDEPRHCLLFYVPRAALNAIADDANSPHIGDLNYKPCGHRGRHDFRPRQHNAVGAPPSRASQPVVCRPRHAGPSGFTSLRPMEAFDGGVPLKDVARECRLSLSHFSRAFRRFISVVMVVSVVVGDAKAIRSRRRCRRRGWARRWVDLVGVG